MDFRARTGADGVRSSWSWPADTAATGNASGNDTSSAMRDDGWATTSGFDSGSKRQTRPHQATVTSESDNDGTASVGSFPGVSDNASWITENEERTPLEHNHFHYRGDANEYGFDNERHGPGQQKEPTEEERAQERYRRRFKPRTCRICFETVLPTFEDSAADPDDGLRDMMGEDDATAEPVGLGAAVQAVGEATAGLRDRVAGAVTSALPTFVRSSRMPRVRYISENPEDGRLISPCRCKGSQKYVHDGCLQAWRKAQPMAERNFWKCPTCGFEYRIQRLRWGRLISNKITRALMTLLVFGLTLFVLGFVADPLMDLWVDPSGVIMDTFLDVHEFDTDDDLLGSFHDVLGGGGGSGVGGVADFVGVSGWWEHFIKGLFSLGIVGVVKTFFVVSPFTWFNLRGVGLGRGRRRAAGGGRGRYESMSWIFILVGAFTFLGVAWNGINYLSGRLLERASEQIIDIGAEGPDDDEEDTDAGHAEADGSNVGIQEAVNDDGHDA
ncbi:RING finger domain protein [Sporothrix schenckii 1099-18]|nr:RING finger domain protein [Sporothrix schenckii 1099-18]KJR87068.1 RING finger domain protein [Sporothrix schenckii 1099-18]